MRRCARAGRSPRSVWRSGRGPGDRAAAAAGREAIAAGNRAVSEVAGEYGVSWPTAHKALIAAAAVAARAGAHEAVGDR